MRKIFLSLLLSAVVIQLNAEELIGAVFNQKEKPVKKVKVWRKNTAESVVTGSDGQFILNVNPTDTLVIAANKKHEAVFPIGSLSNITIKLGNKEFFVHDGTNETRYAYTPVKRIGHNSNILTRAQIQELNAASIYDLLRGRIPGVTVNFAEGGQYISIRGGSSLEQNTEPIFVIDGVIFEHSSDVDGTINIADIERLEVSKDGNAYGVRGANGAIIITTLKNK